MYRLTETEIITRPAACSWCCGDLRGFVSQAGYRMVCVHCGRSIPMERHHPGCRTVDHAHPTGRCTAGMGSDGERCVSGATVPYGAGGEERQTPERVQGRNSAAVHARAAGARL
jgi:hypothetical protein